MPDVSVDEVDACGLEEASLAELVDFAAVYGTGYEWLYHMVLNHYCWLPVADVWLPLIIMRDIVELGCGIPVDVATIMDVQYDRPLLWIWWQLEHLLPLEVVYFLFQAHSMLLDDGYFVLNVATRRIYSMVCLDNLERIADVRALTNFARAACQAVESARSVAAAIEDAGDRMSDVNEERAQDDREPL